MKIILIGLLIFVSAFLIAYFMSVVRMIFSKEKITLIQMFFITLMTFSIVIAYLVTLTKVLEAVLY